MRLIGIGLLAGGLGLGGCASVRMDFQRLPDAAALGKVQPGVTTRSGVLRVLGPPEEYRRPAVFERARLSTPQKRRIAEAGEIFALESFTYASGHRSVRSFGILPIGRSVFRISWRREVEERWRIDFDGAGVVSSVARVDERGEARD